MPHRFFFGLSSSILFDIHDNIIYDKIKEKSCFVWGKIYAGEN